MIDQILGSESDTGLRMTFICGVCGASHRVTVSRIGWYAYDCGPRRMTGEVSHVMLADLHAQQKEVAHG